MKNKCYLIQVIGEGIYLPKSKSFHINGNNLPDEAWFDTKDQANVICRKQLKKYKCEILTCELDEKSIN